MKTPNTPETMPAIFARVLRELSFCLNGAPNIYCGKSPQAWKKAGPRERARLALLEVAEGLRHGQ